MTNETTNDRPPKGNDSWPKMSIKDRIRAMNLDTNAAPIDPSKTTRCFKIKTPPSKPSSPSRVFAAEEKSKVIPAWKQKAAAASAAERERQNKPNESGGDENIAEKENGSSSETRESSSPSNLARVASPSPTLTAFSSVSPVSTSSRSVTSWRSKAKEAQAKIERGGLNHLRKNSIGTSPQTDEGNKIRNSSPSPKSVPNSPSRSISSTRSWWENQLKNKSKGSEEEETKYVKPVPSIVSNTETEGKSSSDDMDVDSSDDPAHETNPPIPSESVIQNEKVTQIGSQSPSRSVRSSSPWQQHQEPKTKIVPNQTEIQQQTPAYKNWLENQLKNKSKESEEEETKYVKPAPSIVSNTETEAKSSSDDVDADASDDPAHETYSPIPSEPVIQNEKVTQIGSQSPSRSVRSSSPWQQHQEPKTTQPSKIKTFPNQIKTQQQTPAYKSWWENQNQLKNKSKESEEEETKYVKPTPSIVSNTETEGKSSSDDMDVDASDDPAHETNPPIPSEPVIQNEKVTQICSQSPSRSVRSSSPWQQHQEPKTMQPSKIKIAPNQTEIQQQTPAYERFPRKNQEYDSLPEDTDASSEDDPAYQSLAFSLQEQNTSLHSQPTGVLTSTSSVTKSSIASSRQDRIEESQEKQPEDDDLSEEQSEDEDDLSEEQPEDEDDSSEEHPDDEHDTPLKEESREESLGSKDELAKPSHYETKELSDDEDELQDSTLRKEEAEHQSGEGRNSQSNLTMMILKSHAAFYPTYESPKRWDPSVGLDESYSSETRLDQSYSSDTMERSYSVDTTTPDKNEISYTDLDKAISSEDDEPEQSLAEKKTRLEMNYSEDTNLSMTYSTETDFSKTRDIDQVKGGKHAIDNEVKVDTTDSFLLPDKSNSMADNEISGHPPSTKNEVGKLKISPIFLSSQKQDREMKVEISDKQMETKEQQCQETIVDDSVEQIDSDEMHDDKQEQNVVTSDEEMEQTDVTTDTNREESVAIKPQAPLQDDDNLQKSKVQEKTMQYFHFERKVTSTRDNPSETTSFTTIKKQEYTATDKSDDDSDTLSNTFMEVVSENETHVLSAAILSKPNTVGVPEKTAPVPMNSLLNNANNSISVDTASTRNTSISSQVDVSTEPTVSQSSSSLSSSNKQTFENDQNVSNYGSDVPSSTTESMEDPPRIPPVESKRHTPLKNVEDEPSESQADACGRLSPVSPPALIRSSQRQQQSRSEAPSEFQSPTKDNRCLSTPEFNPTQTANTPSPRALAKFSPTLKKSSPMSDKLSPRARIAMSLKLRSPRRKASLKDIKGQPVNQEAGFTASTPEDKPPNTCRSSESPNLPSAEINHTNSLDRRSTASFSRSKATNSKSEASSSNDSYRESSRIAEKPKSSHPNSEPSSKSHKTLNGRQRLLQKANNLTLDDKEPLYSSQRSIKSPNSLPDLGIKSHCIDDETVSSYPFSNPNNKISRPKARLTMPEAKPSPITSPKATDVKSDASSGASSSGQVTSLTTRANKLLRGRRRAAPNANSDDGRRNLAKQLAQNMIHDSQRQHTESEKKGFTKENRQPLDTRHAQSVVSDPSCAPLVDQSALTEVISNRSAKDKARRVPARVVPSGEEDSDSDGMDEILGEYQPKSCPVAKRRPFSARSRPRKTPILPPQSVGSKNAVQEAKRKMPPKTTPATNHTASKPAFHPSLGLNEILQYSLTNRSSLNDDGYGEQFMSMIDGACQNFGLKTLQEFRESNSDSGSTTLESDFVHESNIKDTRVRIVRSTEPEVTSTDEAVAIEIEYVGERHAPYDECNGHAPYDECNGHTARVTSNTEQATRMHQSNRFRALDEGHSIDQMKEWESFPSIQISSSNGKQHVDATKMLLAGRSTAFSKYEPPERSDERKREMDRNHAVSGFFGLEGQVDYCLE